MQASIIYASKFPPISVRECIEIKNMDDFKGILDASVSSNPADPVIRYKDYEIQRRIWRPKENGKYYIYEFGGLFTW